MLGPFDMTGGPFLILYGALLAAALVATVVIGARLRPEGRDQRLTDADLLARLAGGRDRFVDATVAGLFGRGALKMVGKDSFAAATRDGPFTTAERSVLALPAPIRWSAISATLKGYAEPVERKLTQMGLLMTGEERGNLRFWRTLPLLMLFVFGATKWLIGDARERPIGFLTILLIVTAVFALMAWFGGDKRTKAGREAVARAAEQAERLRRAPTAPELGLAVAIFGTTVLAGSAWEDYHQLRSSDGGGSSSSASDGGDGGGGGGGCGGCGGG